MPNVNFKSFIDKDAFRSCFTNIEKLTHLDVSASKIVFNDKVLDMIRNAKQLRYLNIGTSILSEELLREVVWNFQLLQSLNLSGCPSHVVGYSTTSSNFLYFICT